MKHLDEDVLRAMLDEASAYGEDALGHVAHCDVCRQRQEALAADASFAQNALSGEARVDLDAAAARLERALYEPARTARWYLPAALTAAAAFALALVFTPLGGYASAFLTIFQPKEFVPIDISQADFRELRVAPQEDQLGTMRVIRKPERSTYPSVQAAQPHVAFNARVPAQIPSAVRATRSFVVSTPGEYLYTFSASKARAFEAKSHKSLPPMPPALNGTTVHVHVGQTFVAEYGVLHAKRGEDEDAQREGLTVVEMQVPTIRSTGASFQELERYMLSLPGISPDLATQLRALGDLQNRMPVPVNVAKQNAHPVTVDGVQGLAIGDNTGLGAGVMWQKNGIIYGVMGGPLTMDQVLALANGLR